MFCKHQWITVDKEILPSAYEQVSKNDQVSAIEAKRAYFRKTYICILKCVECGKLNKTMVSSI